MERNEWNFVVVLCTKRREVAVRSLSPFSPLQRQVRQVQINNGFRSAQEKKSNRKREEINFPDFHVSPGQPWTRDFVIRKLEFLLILLKFNLILSVHYI